MIYKKQCSAYGVARETLDKTRQVVMLYDGMIKFTMQARHAIEENQIAERFNALDRAYKILIGLQSSLDFDKGERIAAMLFGFYLNMSIRLMALNQSRSVKDCDEIIQDMKTMRDAWEKVSNASSESDAYAILAPSQESLTAKLESIAVSI